MDVSVHKVYTYDRIRQLLAFDDQSCFCKDNGPMNKNPLRAHKGLDNNLIFRVLGPDRVPYDVSCGQEVYGRIIDTGNNTIVLEKLAKLGPAKGIIQLELNAGDIVDIPAAKYKMVLIRTEIVSDEFSGFNKVLPLYTDMDDNVSMELEITEQAIANPIPSIVYTSDLWTPDYLSPTVPAFYTGRIPGSRILNHKHGVHSFSTYTENFTGTLQVWGTLEETPDAYLDDTRWFKIYPSGSSDIIYTGYTGTKSWTFENNVMWLRFRYMPSTAVLDSGVFKKLIVRP